MHDRPSTVAVREAEGPTSAKTPAFDREAPDRPASVSVGLAGRLRTGVRRLARLAYDLLTQSP